METKIEEEEILASDSPTILPKKAKKEVIRNLTHKFTLGK